MADEALSGGERTEEATPKRREESRHKGSVAKSMEVNSALVLLSAILLLQSGGVLIASRLSEFMRMFFREAASTQVTPAALQRWLMDIAAFFILTVGPILFGLMVIGFAASAAQVGFHFSWEILRPKGTRLNPLSGLKRIFASQHAAVEVLKNFVKIVLIGVIGWSTVSGLLDEAVGIMDADPATVAGFLVRAALRTATKMGLAFLGLAAIDYAYQRFDHERNLRMTKQEVKEESKMYEGDPLVKGRIRSIQRQIAYKRMMQDVPKADVVVTNPTHVAVALKYDAGTMQAPKVVAKGADLIAQRIRQIALEHHVPVVEDRLLARTLFKTVDVGEQVPEKLFQAIAQLLAFIYRMKHVTADAS